MRIDALRIFKWVFIILLQFTFMGCAMGQKAVFHGFTFNAKTDSPGIEILDWQYGEKNVEYDATQQGGLRAPKYKVIEGISMTSGGTAGVIPVGKFVYVKWRIMNTGEIIEDRVDLKGRLPNDMESHAIHFVIKNKQLYIYLIPPYERKDEFGRVTVHSGGWDPSIYKRIDKDPVAAAYIKKHQIYPNK